MWRDPAWVLDMLQAASKALEYAHGLTEDQYRASSRDQDAIIRQLTIVGEAAKRVSPEFRAEHPEIPWRKIAGFRDVLVHDYFACGCQRGLENCEGGIALSDQNLGTPDSA